MSSRRPSQRFVVMESVAALAACLCGPGGADITGAILPIDGGWSAS
jgi:3-hydroxybutyrate dehydrogenase